MRHAEDKVIARCAHCQAQETIMPGWPLNGLFPVVRDARICLRCCRELARKLECLGIDIFSQNRVG